MSFLHRGDTVRLKDRKTDNAQTVRRYTPPRPLSWLGCVIVIALSAVLLVYGVILLALHFGGVETLARVNTRLDESGKVEEIELLGMTTMVNYTFQDGDGYLHEGRGSLIGNREAFESTIPVRYFAPLPSLNMLSFRTQDLLTPFGALLLGLVLLYTGVSRLKKILSGAASERESLS